MNANVMMISGHRDVTQEEFDEHYVPMLDKAMEEKCSFVVGDCEGVDFMAQEYLYSKGEMNVIVFHMFTDPRFAVERYKHLGGFQSDVDRDFAMTLFSDEDLCWIRKGKERSGTAQNIERRKLKEQGVHTIQEIMTLEASMFL